jgi:uncharacterized protein
LLLPDVNVWVALHHENHFHHRSALDWFNRLPERRKLVFCRQTQLSLFRLLTTPSVMADEVSTQQQCWSIYEKWVSGGRAVMQPEPPLIEGAFRARSRAAQSSPKMWTDCYLAAFAETAGLTLVTFDKALAAKTKGALLLS